MIPEKFRDIIKNFQNEDRMDFFEGVTEEEINAFEESNEMKLPTQYKEWLNFSDGGELFLPDGIQLYGVSHKPLIENNTDDRLDESYIVIGALSFGDPIMCRKGEEQIFIFNHEDGTIAEDETYSDFVSFLVDLPAILGIEV